MRTHTEFHTEFMEPPRFYERVMPLSVQYVLLYSILGGIIAGALAYFPARRMLQALIPTPSRLTDTNILVLALVIIALLLLGVAAVLILLDKRFVLSSRRGQFFTGAGVGAMFSLTAHSVLIGSLVGLAANREAFAFLYQVYDTQSAVYLEIIGRAVYFTVIEGVVMGLLIVGLCTLAGAVMGCFLLASMPKKKHEDFDGSRDVFGALLALTLPHLFLMIAIVNITIFCLLNSALMDLFNEANAIAPTPLPLTLFVAYPPLYGMLIVQAVALLWLWHSRPLALHRSMLRLAQVGYGLAWTFGLYPFMKMMNPCFVCSQQGRTIIGVSMALSLLYLVMAQCKLRTAYRAGVSIDVETSAWGIVGTGLVVLVVGFLLLDLMGLRVMYNMAIITIQLLPSAPHVNPTISLDAIFDEAMLNFWKVALAPMGIIVLISLVPIGVFAWLTNAAEKRRRRS